MSRPTAGDAIAVLASGGADSAILVADLLRRGRAVHPINVRFGLAWEAAEEAHLRRFLATLTDPAPRPLVVLDVPIAPVYGSHWSVSGERRTGRRHARRRRLPSGAKSAALGAAQRLVPAERRAPDRPGHAEGQPVPRRHRRVLHRVLGARRARDGPRSRGASRPSPSSPRPMSWSWDEGLALEQTFSCIDPRDGRHCGRCNKCAERRHAFASCSIDDRTDYAQS